MIEDSASYKVSVDVGLGQDPSPVRPSQERPFHVLVMGDFTGRESRGIVDPEGALRRTGPVLVDAGNLQNLAGMKPVLRWNPSTSPTSGEGRKEGPREAGGLPIPDLTFQSPDDFHPDRLVDVVPGLRDLLSLKPAPPEKKRVPSQGPKSDGEAPGPMGGGLLDAILQAEPEGPIPTTPAPTDALSAFIRRVMEPHLVSGDSEAAEAFRSRVHDAAGELVDGVLHHRGFRSLEALWRGVHFLLARVGSDASLGIHLLDVSKAELLADAGVRGGVGDSGLYYRLGEVGPGDTTGTPWALVVAAYSFGTGPNELALLYQLSAVAHLCGVPVVSAADPALAGFQAFGVEPEQPIVPAPGSWQEFRISPFARALGLVTPRFLLRLPYGEETEAVGSFPYEEAGGDPGHDDYLWGNPAFAVATLVGEAFRARGWNLDLQRHLELGGLPLHVRRKPGTSATPCAEALLTDSQAGRVLDRGIMPLRSVRNADRARLSRMQSVSHPVAPLAAWWNR